MHKLSYDFDLNELARQEVTRKLTCLSVNCGDAVDLDDVILEVQELLSSLQRLRDSLQKL